MRKVSNSTLLDLSIFSIRLAKEGGSINFFTVFGGRFVFDDMHTYNIYRIILSVKEINHIIYFISDYKFIIKNCSFTIISIG